MTGGSLSPEQVNFESGESLGSESSDEDEGLDDTIKATRNILLNYLVEFA